MISPAAKTLPRTAAVREGHAAPAASTLTPEVGERDARAQRIAGERRPRRSRCAQWVFAGARPSVAQSSSTVVVEPARAHRGVETGDGLREPLRREPQLLSPARASVSARLARKDRRHEAAERLGIDDRVGDLPGLAGDEPSPDRIALGPEILALVVEAPAFAVDHDAERHAVDARRDAAVELRRAGVERDRRGTAADR